MFTLGHPAQGMAGSCSGIRESGECCHLVTAWRSGQQTGIATSHLCPLPLHHHPLNSQHSTNPANRKRILILESKKGACQSLSDMARRCQALCPWTPRPTQGKEGLSLELLSCFVMLEGTAGSRWRREGPGALTHLEEHQIGLKKGKRKMKSQQCPNLVFH